jgi:Thaumarchaeal output domain 1
VAKVLQIKRDNQKIKISMVKEMMNILQDDQGVITYKGHTFFSLYPNSGKKIEELLDYSVILIHAAHSAYASFTIQRLRAFNDSRMYLKPIFFLQPSMDSGHYINTIIDGSIFNLNQLDAILPRVEDILIKNQSIKHFEPNAYESVLVMKLLSFAFTRGRKNIEPIPYIFSGINYAYPGLSSNFENFEEHKVFEILNLAEKEGLIKGEFYDKSHYCNHCNHGALNYRSVCPKCSSSNSETQDIIHHFPCGNVGPMSDYNNRIDDGLTCPKCNKNLRHIGVDYDKPSVLHYCKKCTHRFQDFDVKAKCLNCEFDNTLDALIEKEVKSYSITNKGENAAVYGYNVVNREVEAIPGTVTFDFFETMISLETERMRVRSHEGAIAAIHIHNGAELLSKVGKDRSSVLLSEIVSQIRMYIRSYDLVAFKNTSLLVFSLIDVAIEDGVMILLEIVELLSKLIAHNVKDFTLVIDKKIQPLTTTSSSKNQLDLLLEYFQ